MKQNILIILLLFFFFDIPITFSIYLNSLHSFQNYAAPPKLSKIAFETNHNGQIDFTIFKNYLTDYNLTQSEIAAFFRLCDQNKRNFLSFDEWNNCVEIFVIPFERNCLKSKHYLLLTAELSKCLKLPDFDTIVMGSANSEESAKMIIKAINRDYEGKINLMDYIFLRRLTMAWKECSVDNRLNKARMECAITITTPKITKFLPVANQIFNIAIQLYKTKIKENEAFLDFFSFSKIAYLYYYFNEFLAPYQQESLTKSVFIKGIEDQILPTSISVEWINQIFYFLDPENNGYNVRLEFASFAGILHCLRIYKKSLEKHVFNIKSFEKLLKEKEWDYFNSVAMNEIISSDYIYKKYNHVNETNEYENINERTYFTRFGEKEENMKETEKHRIIFNIFDSNFKGKWNFTNLVNFAKFTWIFQTIDVSLIGTIVVDDIYQYLNHQKSIIPLNKFDLLAFEQMTNQIITKQINIKQFYSYFMYPNILSQLQVPKTLRGLTLTNLNGFKQLSLKISKQTKKISKKSSDSYKIPLYDYVKAFKRAIKEEIILYQLFKLEKNKNSRKD